MKYSTTRKTRRPATEHDKSRHVQMGRQAIVDIIINEEVNAHEFWNNFAMIKKDDVPLCLHPFMELSGSYYTDARLDDALAARDWARAIPGFEDDGQPAIIFAFPKE